MIGFVQGGVCLSVMDGCARPYAEFDSLGNKPVIVCIICLAVIGVFECSSPAAAFILMKDCGRRRFSLLIGQEER